MQDKHKLAKASKLTGSVLFASILLSGSFLNTTKAFADTTSQQATATSLQVSSAKKVDKAVLEKAITGALNKVDGDKTYATYTSDTAAEVRTTLNNAWQVKNSSDSTQEEVDEAAKDLNKAVSNLKENTEPVTEVNKWQLNENIAISYSIINGYTDMKFTKESVEALRAAVPQAEEVNNNVNATQKQVDKAELKLSAVLSSIVVAKNAPTTPVKVDKEELQDEYDKAIQYKVTDYTNVSFSGLQQKVNYALSILKATDSSQVDVDKAVAGLKSGIAGLVAISSSDTSKTTVKNGQVFENGHWYFYKNNVKQTGLQYIANQHKTVYYNSNGQMQYGQQYINGHWYLFDSNTGAMKTGLQYIANQHKTVYYNSKGQMQYGQQRVNGKTYYFNKATGALQK